MRSYSKGKANGRPSPHQASFELKKRTVLALNKIADRDTYQLGIEDLEKIVESLTPDGIGSFVGCIVDMESEPKSAVRKECVRVLAMLARIHGQLIVPYVGKMVTSIVKRLKDPDSTVRDACVETVGILVSTLCRGSSSDDYNDQNGALFVAFIKPLFEALGEQNKQVQSSAALCMAAVINNSQDPPLPLLQKILTRVMKLLRNLHFMAKPALIELTSSIILVGGAVANPSTALTCICEALKHSEWTTRKAAAMALGSIAVNIGTSLVPFKESCITSLEVCRFDKVKPVRDSAMQALHQWKSLSENSYMDADRSSVGDSGWKDIPLSVSACPSSVMEGNITSGNQKPPTEKKVCVNYKQRSQKSQQDDWHVEIAVPKSRPVLLANADDEESEGSCITRSVNGKEPKTSRSIYAVHDVSHKHISGKFELSSASKSDLSFERNRFQVNNSSANKKYLGKDIHLSSWHEAEAEAADQDNDMLPREAKERRSMDSNLTDVHSNQVGFCCSNTARELAHIRKYLSEIENKQSSLFDLMQVFMHGSMETLSLLQAKVLTLETTIDKIALDLSPTGNCTDPVTTKLWPNESISSPTVSLHSSKATVERVFTKLQISPSHVWKKDEDLKVRPRSLVKKAVAENAAAPAVNIMKKAVENFRGSIYEKVASQPGKAGVHSSPYGLGGKRRTCVNNHRTNTDRDFWQRSRNRINELLRSNDMESAYIEAISSEDDQLLMELMDATGPIVDQLSSATMNEIYRISARLLANRTFVECLVPWLQQVVELGARKQLTSSIPSVKIRRELMAALQEAAVMHFAQDEDRSCFAKLALKLNQVWG